MRKGWPFRETHHVSGTVVALAEAKGIPMDGLSLAELQGVDGRFEEDVRHVFDYEASVEKEQCAWGDEEGERGGAD